LPALERRSSMHREVFSNWWNAIPKVRHRACVLQCVRRWRRTQHAQRVRSPDQLGIEYQLPARRILEQGGPVFSSLTAWAVAWGEPWGSVQSVAWASALA
jgi:hypothetical protein